MLALLMTLTGTFASINGERLALPVRISEGSQVTTLGSRVVFAGPQSYYYGSIIGQLHIQAMRKEGCGIRNILFFKGRLTIRAREKTCKQSALFVFSESSGHSFEVNSDVALTQREDGTTILGVREGNVPVTGWNGPLIIARNNQAVVAHPGQAASPPVEISKAYSVRNNVTAFGREVTINTSPANTLSGPGQITQNRFRLSSVESNFVKLTTPFGDEVLIDLRQYSNKGLN